MIKNIAFDMDSVLIVFDPPLFLDRLGVTGEDRRMLLWEVFRSLEWAQLDRGDLTDAQAIERMCRRLPERLHDSVRRLVSEWDLPILPIPGMQELVRELKQNGYKLYLLSNAALRQHDYWPRIPGSECFDGVVVSADLRLIKPEREIYQHLFKTYDLVPEECVFIDDNVVNIEGAHRLGMNTVVFHGEAWDTRRRLRELGVSCAE